MGNRLELTWYGKENEIKVESRILIENKHNSNYLLNNNSSNNLLIHVDNLLALKTLESKFANQVRCIYIDLPYNTGNAFTSYDDNIEHSTWLNFMYPRLCIMRKLLAEDEFMCIQIDISPNSRSGQTPESPYLNIICDEIFGRNNYVGTLICKKKGNASKAQFP